MEITTESKKVKKAKIAWTLRRQKALYGYLFISPFIIGFLLLFLTPLLQSLSFSFSDLQVTATGYELQYSGLKNYIQILRVDPNFIPLLLKNVIEVMAQVPVILIFSFFAASLLNQKFKGRALARGIFFLPVILTSGIILAIESSDLLISAAQGAAEEELENAATFQFLQFKKLLYSLNLPSFMVNFIVLAVDQIYDIAIASGVQILIFLAGLQSVPKSLYEAASMEGATGWESFWKITFPIVSPLIIVNLIYTVINTFTSSDNEVMTLIQNTIFNQVEFGFGSAMAWVYLASIAVMLGIFSLVVLRLLRNYQT